VPSQVGFLCYFPFPREQPEFAASEEGSFISQDETGLSEGFSPAMDCISVGFLTLPLDPDKTQWPPCQSEPWGN
jgi:hypothetical protein